eukprot:3194680-Amphidinium_carterae.3
MGSTLWHLHCHLHGLLFCQHLLIQLRAMWADKNKTSQHEHPSGSKDPNGGQEGCLYKQLLKEPPKPMTSALSISLSLSLYHSVLQMHLCGWVHLILLL